MAIPFRLRRAALLRDSGGRDVSETRADLQPLDSGLQWLCCRRDSALLRQLPMGTLVQLAMVVSVRDHPPARLEMNLQTVIQGRQVRRTAGWGPALLTVAAAGCHGSWRASWLLFAVTWPSAG